MAALQSDPESGNNSAPPVLIPDRLFPTCPSLTLPSDVSGLEQAKAKGNQAPFLWIRMPDLGALVFSFFTRLFSNSSGSILPLRGSACREEHGGCLWSPRARVRWAQREIPFVSLQARRFQSLPSPTPPWSELSAPRECWRR